jgi:hypothetical protein
MKVLNKYIIVLLISSLFGMPWMYLKHLLFDLTQQDIYSIVDTIPGYANYLIRLIIILLLLVDFKREKLKSVWVACLSSLFYPLLGVVIFGLLYIEKNKEMPVPNNG